MGQVDAVLLIVIRALIIHQTANNIRIFFCTDQFILHFQGFPLHFNQIVLSMYLCSILVCLTVIWLWKTASHVAVFTATVEKE